MPADLDTQVGILFRKLSVMRLEFDEASFQMTIQDLMQALGVAAMRRAEDRARAIRDRARPAACEARVVPFMRRRPDPRRERDDEH